MGNLKQNSNRKKIGLYLACTPSSGGAFQYALSQLQALKTLEDESQIELIVFYEDTIWIKTLEAHRIIKSIHCSASRMMRNGFYKIWRTLHLPMALWRFITPFFQPNVRAILKENCAAVFFPSQDTMSYYGPYKSITSIHDLMHRYEDFPEVRNKKEYASRETLYKNICKFSEIILVDSKVGEQHVVETYGEEYRQKIRVLHYIIPHYIEDKKPDYGIISRLDIKSDFLFYPAQFWKHKNHKNLVIAFSIVKKQFPSLDLVLSGIKNNASEDLNRLIKELKLEKSIHLAGYVTEEEIVALYTKSRCLVMPTFFGPTNIPPLEALALGTEVVYSKIYAYEEFLGNSAFFVDPKDPEDIAKKIVNVLNGESRINNYDSKERRSLFLQKIKQIISEIS